MRDNYKKQVSLLIDMLPFILKDERVALKGGTAINLFHQELPRLSVDVDLCYLSLEERSVTFKHLHDILSQIKEDLESNFKASVIATNPLDEKKESKLIARVNDVEIKIEPNFILRGSLFKPLELETSETTNLEFEKKVKIKCLCIADTYGGKICAALDRQHPRDLFDIKYLFQNEGVSRDVKDSFLFYLMSHNRPINEILNPRLKDITELYNFNFVDMALVHTSQKELEDIRLKLIEEVKNKLDSKDKEFLISFVKNEPRWDLYNFEKIKDYPSIKWKLFNQSKMSSAKQKEYARLLKNYFDKVKCE